MTDRASVAPILELAGVHAGAHRDVATRSEFEHYVDRWLERGHARFNLGYLAFHGSRTGLSLGDGEDLSLVDMAGIFRGRLADKTLHLGSCAVLAVADDELRHFVAESGAKAVIGYTKDVEWLESASFECQLLPELLRGADLRALYKRMSTGHSAFVEGLGFRVVTRTYVSPRKSALAAMPQE